LAVLVWVSAAQSAACEKRFSPQDRDLPRDPKKVQNRTWTIMQGNQQEPSSLKKDDSTQHMVCFFNKIFHFFFFLGIRVDNIMTQ
jgi:hypothetical protein